MRLNKKKAVRDLLKRKGGPKGPDKYWPMMKEHLELGLELRKPFQERWLLNLSFISGKQYTFYNRSAEILQQITARKGRVRIVDNKILPRYRKQISRLIRNRPIMSVVPDSNEQEDIEAAKVGDKVMRSFWRSNKMQGKIRSLGGWIYGCGNGFLDDRWNPKKGPMQLDGEGQMRYLGDVECGVWSPLEVVVPASGLGDTDLHSMPWMIKHKFRNLEYFQNNYKKGKKVVAEDRSGYHIGSHAVLGVNVGVDAGKVPGAEEVQLYIQPCGDFPKGKYLVGANGVVLIDQDYPFDYYHMEQFKDIEIPGVFYGMATTEAAIWLQKLWNRTLSDIAEFNRTMGRGKWLIPRGSNIQVDPDDSHGQKLLYTPKMGYKPEHLSLKGLPASYQQVLETVAMGLMEVYHQHEVSSGTNRSDIRSGEMVQLLLEQDDFGNVPTHAVFEESLEAVMARVLERIQKGYSSDRAIQVTGRGGEFEVLSFKGADLRGNTAVHVKKESSLPDSKVGRQNQVLERFGQGLYGDPQDPEVRRHVMNMLDDSVTQDIYGDIFQDEQLARIENKHMVKNFQQIQINLYDNHTVHVAEHNRFRKSHEFQALKRESGMIERRRFLQQEMLFTAHVAQHQKILESIKRQQIQQMAMAKGGGG